MKEFLDHAGVFLEEEITLAVPCPLDHNIGAGHPGGLKGLVQFGALPVGNSRIRIAVHDQERRVVGREVRDRTGQSCFFV